MTLFSRMIGLFRGAAPLYLALPLRLPVLPVSYMKMTFTDLMSYLLIYARPHILGPSTYDSVFSSRVKSS